MLEVLDFACTPGLLTLDFSLIEVDAVDLGLAIELL